MLFCLPGLACGVFQTKDEEAPATAIAASIYSTMTAEAPPATLTEIPTLTPTETLIPTDTIVPSATLTDTPTNTQTPTSSATPTPIPSIFLPTCNCIEKAREGEFIVVRLRWGGQTEEITEEGADNVGYTLTINGERVEDINQYRKKAVFKPDPSTNLDVWWVYWDYPLGIVEKGRYVADARFFALDNLNDMLYKFIIPKGFSSNWKVIVNVSE